MLGVADPADPSLVRLDGSPVDDAGGSFANPAQRTRFLQLWDQRWAEVLAALEAIDALGAREALAKLL